MNILVCIKQVPDTHEIALDEENHTLLRAGVPSIVNPFDLYALALAAQFQKTQPETKIVIVSMGPPQAERALRTCLATAGEHAYLISDRLFAGSDTLATSYILSCSVKTIEEREGPFDCILCGKQAIDGDTAQVGVELAEHLHLPQATGVIEAQKEENLLRVKRETERGYEILHLLTPCLLTVSKLKIEPNIPSLRAKLASRKIPITQLSVEDLISLDTNRIGLKGSPTRVISTHAVERKSSGVLIDKGSDALNVVELVRLLKEKDFL